MRTFRGSASYGTRQNRAVEATVVREQTQGNLELGNEDDKLSDKQWTAISYLAAGKTLQATADNCQINVRTLRRWLQSSDFAEEYKRARRQQMEALAASLQSAANEAMATLMRHLKCGDPQIELRAAKTIFQIYQKSVENAELTKTIYELQQTNERQAEDIRTLEKENRTLRVRDSEVDTLKLDTDWPNNRLSGVTSSASHSALHEGDLIPGLSLQSIQSVPTGKLQTPV